METIGFLRFLSRDTDQPAFIINPAPAPSQRIGSYQDIPLRLRDARGQRQGRIGLEQTGFELCKAKTEADFSSESRIRETYYPEVERLARRLTGAGHAVILDHTLRSTAPGSGGRGAVLHAHNDYTPASAMAHADRLAEAAGVERPARVVQINLWRPLAEPVIRAPLAFCDARSVRPADLVACPVIYPDRRGEIFELRYHPDQRWYWFPRMRRDEVVVFKGHDSAEGAATRHVPHTAFDPEDLPADAPERRSIEVRAFCFLT